MSPGDKDSPSTKSQWPSRRADERAEVRETFCPKDEENSQKNLHDNCSLCCKTLFNDEAMTLLL